MLGVPLLVGSGVEGGEPLLVSVVVAVREGVGVPVDESDGVTELLGVDERLAPSVGLAVTVCAALGVPLAVSELVGEGVTRPVPEPLCDGVGDCVAVTEGELLAVREPLVLGVTVAV